MLIASATGWLWMVYPLAFLEAMISQFHHPAKRALVPLLVSAEQLPDANALSSTSDDLANIVGPALGGLMSVSFFVTADSVLQLTTSDPQGATTRRLNTNDLRTRP